VYARTQFFGAGLADQLRGGVITEEIKHIDEEIQRTTEHEKPSRFAMNRNKEPKSTHYFRR
jgi:hypothetical protein